MAGQTPGATAHASLTDTAPALLNALRLVPTTTTRTRRHHGAFTLGGQLACVYSSRRSGQCYGVSFELGAGTLTLASTMTPAQARNMARALAAAADAAEDVQHQAQEGGAA
jgi:hypothetical protein